MEWNTRSSVHRMKKKMRRLLQLDYFRLIVRRDISKFPRCAANLSVVQFIFIVHWAKQLVTMLDIIEHLVRKF